MAEGEIVAHRILRIEACQRIGNFDSGTKICCAISSESKILRKLMDMCVDGAHKCARRNVPQSEVDSIGGPDHPTQEKIETLVCTPHARIGQKMFETS